jgi:hypothetical protein
MSKADRRFNTHTKTRLTETDPIFAAIEHHKKLDQIFFDRCRDGRACQRDVDLALEAAERAAWKMSKTKPGTVAGCAAMLAYISNGDCVGLFDVGETAWHQTAFGTVAKTLKKLASV